MEGIKYKVGDIICSNISHTMIGKITELYNDHTGMVMVGNKNIYVDLKYWIKYKEVM